MTTAADTKESFPEDARWGRHGVIMHFLLRELAGESDAETDGIVTFSEYFDFVSTTVVAATGGRQNPRRAGYGDTPLAVVGAPGAA